MTRLTLEHANAVISGTFSAAHEAGGAPIAVVVLDASGHIIAVQRQDGTTMFRVDVALGKAWGVVAFGASSRALAEKASSNPNFFQALSVAAGGKLLPNPGAVPIFDGDGKLIGAVGVSGDSGERDEVFALGGVAAAGLKSTAT